MIKHLSFILSSALLAGCGSSIDCAHPPPASVVIGTGAGGFEPIGPEGVLIEHGPQGGNHLFVGLRCAGLGGTVQVNYGARLAQTNELLSPVGLTREVDLDHVGDFDEAGGLFAFLNGGVDLQALVGQEVTLWAEVTGECGGAPTAAQANAVVTGFAP